MDTFVTVSFWISIGLLAGYAYYKIMKNKRG